MLVIVNYGIGNVGSIKNMLKKIGVESIISSAPEAVREADKLIISGVGAFDSAMKYLREHNLVDVLNQKVLIEKVPLLGICLGMQVLTKKSEEGRMPGLGFINAETVKFKNTHQVKIPHMGWNVVIIKKDSYLFDEAHEEPRFYFAHSYHVVCKNELDRLTTTIYGSEFVSSFQRDNIIGVQFHPEKSHKFGMQLFKNFISNR